ncbi:MAG TPA: hypothetical protein GXX46_06200 [Peptococcaceae bacterium]|nr:hypothetical protein [Peptococcaceae bacterium]
MSPEKKRLYALIIVVLFSFIMVMEIGNFRAKQLAVNLAGDRVANAVAQAAAGLEGEKILDVIKTMDEAHPYYSEMRRQLISIKESHELADIYMLYKDEDKVQWFYVVDTREESDPAHHSLGDIEKRASAAVEKTIRGKEAGIELYTSSLGTFVSSYEEIKDAQGVTFAVLAGDFKADELTAFLYLTRYVQFGIIAFALLLIGGILFLTKK